MNFTSKEIQSAFEKAKPVLEQRDQIKDAISNDIKSLEGYFQKIKLNDSFTYLMSDPYSFDSFYSGSVDENSACGEAATKEELIIWDSKQSRLLYQLNHYTAEIDLDSSSSVTLKEGTRKEIEKKPLIETTFEIRERAYKGHLSNFLVMVTERYSVTPGVNSIEDDIPF